jgi:hypothetical protein
MKNYLSGTLVATLISVFLGCKPNPIPPATETAPTTETAAPETSAAPMERVGNQYKVSFKVLRQNTDPAPGFKVDLWVIGKSEPRTFTTNEAGMIEVTDLPFPDAKNQLAAVLHYYTGKNDQEREITYPYIQSDAFRLKDTQYIPNTATPEPPAKK